MSTLQQLVLDAIDEEIKFCEFNCELASIHFQPDFKLQILDCFLPRKLYLEKTKEIIIEFNINKLFTLIGNFELVPKKFEGITIYPPINKSDYFMYRKDFDILSDRLYGIHMGGCPICFPYQCN